MTAAVENRRRAPRFPVYLTTEYESQEQQGSGITTTLSRLGAWIGAATQPVAAGEAIRIRVSAFVGSFATPLPARVVWTNADGFAVEFRDLGPAENDLLARTLAVA